MKKIFITIVALIALVLIPNAAAAPFDNPVSLRSRGVFGQIQTNGTTITADNASELTALVTLEGHTDEVMAVAFSPDGQLLASGSLDGTIRVWSIPEGELTAELTGHQAGVLTLDFSGDGSLLVSGGYDRTARLWDVANAELLKTVDTISRGYVLSVDFAPEDPFFAMADNLCATEIRRVPSGILDQSLPQSTCVRRQGSVQSWGMAFSPDGQQLVKGEGRWCCGGSLQSWPIESPFERPEFLQGNVVRVRDVAFSPDGNRLAIAQLGSSTFWLLDASNGDLIHTFDGHDFRVNSLAFSPDSSLIASGGRDQRLGLWLAESAELIATLKEHQDAINDLQFSPDGSLLATAASDNSVILWGIE